MSLQCRQVFLKVSFFGHAKGAFTGALTAAAGHFESAQGGTLLLDEIGELPSILQSKLLRVLEESRVTRLGETRSRKLDLQIISSTNKELSNACNSGEFRYDLYFRLSFGKDPYSAPSGTCAGHPPAGPSLF